MYECDAVFERYSRSTLGFPAIPHFPIVTELMVYEFVILKINSLVFYKTFSRADFKLNSEFTNCPYI